MTDIPASAARLQSKAEAAGWTVTIRHGAAEYLVLELRRGRELLLGIWQSGKWRNGIAFGRMTWEGRSSARVPTQRLSSKAFGEAVARDE